MGVASPLQLAGEVGSHRRCDPGGGNSLHTNGLTRGGTPTPTLPRKRERERSSDAVATEPDLVTPRKVPLLNFDLCVACDLLPGFDVARVDVALPVSGDEVRRDAERQQLLGDVGFG